MKIWLSNLLQNAAFPTVVLAFACAPLNYPIPDVRTNCPPDQGLRPLLDLLVNDNYIFPFALTHEFCYP
jgi:hypothetical protein